MNQQPDKLFREKLEGLNKPVPSHVWQRVEARLDKKNNSTLWLKVAASLTLVAAASILLWFGQGDDQTQVAVVKAPVQKPSNNQPAEIVKKIAAPAEKISAPEKTDNILPRERVAEKKSTRVKHRIEKNEIKNAPVVVLEEKVEIVQQETVVQHETAVVPSNTTASVPAEQTDGVRLVITAEEANKKYLNNPLTEATSDEKKPSTLRKLLSKAYELKHNQDPFGDLRQKKNEILALNFKGEKQRSQNK